MKTGLERYRQKQEWERLQREQQEKEQECLRVEDAARMEREVQELLEHQNQNFHFQ